MPQAARKSLVLQAFLRPAKGARRPRSRGPAAARAKPESPRNAPARRPLGRGPAESDRCAWTGSPRPSSGWRRRRPRRPISPPPTPSSGRPTAAGFTPVAARQPRRARPAQGHRPHARHPARQHRALRARPARQQCAAVGRARHGQDLAGQGGACRASTRGGQAPAASSWSRSIARTSTPCRALLAHAARGTGYRFIVFCDDLSFDGDDTSYKSLKAVLEGGIEGRPDNVIFYATSNRRHLMPRDMIENERSTAINPGEAVEEKVSLSDRFGLWLGFHNCSQDDYLDMVAAMPRISASRSSRDELRARGARLGDDARRALGPRRLAVHPGSGGALGRAAYESDTPRGSERLDPPASSPLHRAGQDTRSGRPGASPCAARNGAAAR